MEGWASPALSATLQREVRRTNIEARDNERQSWSPGYKTRSDAGHVNSIPFRSFPFSRRGSNRFGRLTVRVTILPKTGLGWASVGLAVGFALFWLLFLLYAAFVLGVGALVTGIVGILKDKDWSILVLLATLIGLFVVFNGVRLMFFAHGV